MQDDEFRKEAERLLGLDEVDIYAYLVAEDGLFDAGGRRAKGMQLFRSHISTLQSLLCSKYVKEGTRGIGNKVDLAVLLATALVGAPKLVDIPLIPLAVLVVKIGLDEFCGAATENRGK
ncbi:MAG: hypothetical protein C4519_21985 [Desulfobacteraceae bacterium]|jgi:hypothetical protein|nr:MAG: hypothetical protein C4519_21985 [Desulfobacteraceae bacterium]